MISVIIPAYNVEKYISKCIESVLAQTYTDYEIIIVDDGSTDSTPRICDNYADNNKIRVIHKEIGGVSSARNAGLAAAQGEFIYFLDSDDYLHNECFEIMTNVLIEDDADMVMSGTCRVKADGRTVDDYNFRSPIKDQKLNSTEFMHILSGVDGYYYCMVWNKLCRKKVFEGIRFPDGKIHEDWACIFKTVNNCKKIVVIEKPLYFYLMHENSITGRKFSLANLDRDDAFYNNIIFLQDNKLDEISKKVAYHALVGIQHRYNQSIDTGLEKEVVKRLASYCKYEYKLAKHLLRNESLKTNVVLWFVAYEPKLYIVLNKAFRKVYRIIKKQTS